MKRSTERFSDCVQDYTQYRPSYPEALIEFIESACGLHPGSIVADIGAGTGIFTKLLLERGYHVFAIEPNAEMLAAAEQRLESYPSLTALPGTAEHTGLPDASVDCITIAQAFHWVDQSLAKQEFSRILRPQRDALGESSGWVVLVWNHRKIEGSPFLQGYEQLLKSWAPEYELVKARTVSAAQIKTFFAPSMVQNACFETVQTLNFEGLLGRMKSSSYVPKEDQPQYEEMVQQLQALFESHQSDGTVRLEYDTVVHYGQIA
jgi:ubiquinone/menaquinone biosynthesis C-methylase UbiE